MPLQAAQKEVALLKEELKSGAEKDASLRSEVAELRATVDQVTRSESVTTACLLASSPYLAAYGTYWQEVHLLECFVALATSSSKVSACRLRTSSLLGTLCLAA